MILETNAILAIDKLCLYQWNIQIISLVIIEIIHYTFLGLSFVDFNWNTGPGTNDSWDLRLEKYIILMFIQYLHPRHSPFAKVADGWM